MQRFAIMSFFFYAATPSLGRSMIPYSRSTGCRQGCVVLQQHGRSWVKGKLLYMRCATTGKGSSKPEGTAFLQYWLFWFPFVQLRNLLPSLLLTSEHRCSI